MNIFDNGKPENIGTLFAAFAKAQSEMAPVVKDALNKQFGNKPNYATLNAALDAIKPALGANGLWIQQHAVTTDGNVVVTTFIGHSCGAYMATDGFALKPTKNDAHGFGSAVTYGRRYALLAVCGLAPEDDDGNAAVGIPDKAPEPPKTITLEQHDALMRSISKCKKLKLVEFVKCFVGVDIADESEAEEALSNMTEGRYAAAMKALAKRQEEEAATND